MSRPTSERNREIVRLRLEQRLTLEEIGTRFGITRERVRQIEESSGIEPRRLVARQRREIRRVFRAVAIAARIASNRAHGSRYAYTQLQCSCDLCRAANAEYQRSLTGRPPPTHGRSGYVNYGCRCESCRTANSAYWREFRERTNKAHGVVHAALRTGRLVRPDCCEDCGAEGPVQGHHEDYGAPLEVEWLCTGCHGARRAPHRQHDQEAA